MPAPFTPLHVHKFEGLVDDTPVEIGEQQASTLQNFYKVRNKLVRRLGQSALGTVNLTPNQAQQMLRWFRIGSTEYLLAVLGGDVRDWFAGTPGAIVTNGTGQMTAGTGQCNACWINGNVYIGDGTAQNVFFNGTRVDRAMVAAPASACTAAADGVGLGNGDYTFKVAYLAANGQLSETGAASNQVTLVGQKADLTNIPLSPETGVTARYIFALGGSSTTYNLVDILADNTSTTRTVNLSTIINPFSPLVTGNTRFPPCKYLVEHQSRMAGAYCTTSEGDKQTLFISNYLQPWYCPLSPNLDDPAQGVRAQLQGPAAGEVTGLHSHGDVLLVFTGGAGFMLTGHVAADFILQKFSNHGCVAHRTIQSTRGLALWLAPDGVYAWNGAAVERISDDVRDTILGMSAADMAAANAYVWNDRYYLNWPNGCLWYDLLHRIWGTNTNNLWDDATVTTYTSSAVQRIYASLKATARARQLETGAQDAGVDIPARWTSRDWDMGLPSRRKRIHLIETKWKKAVSSATATIALLRGTGESIQTVTKDISTVDNASDTVCRQLDGAVETAYDEHFRLDVQITSSLADVELLAAGVHWTIGGSN